MQLDNPFFRPPSDREERPGRGRVYAAIEIAADFDAGEPRKRPGANETVANDADPVSLECVDVEWFHRPDPDLRQAPLSVLELHNYPLPATPEAMQPGEIAWFEIGYSPAIRGESNATSYSSLFSEGVPVQIEFVEPRPREFARQYVAPTLSKWIARPHEDEADSTIQIGELLQSISSSAGVAVYDVGQGACQAVLDEQFHVPLVYVDFGGGVLGNRNTFPRNFRGFCFTAGPPIVLSHWDWDHWSSAYRFPPALDMTWIAPPVTLKPIQVAFAAELSSRGNLVLWPETLPVLKSGSLRLERGQGKTANDSGIVVTVFSQGQRGPSCLLPGDADYQFVPSVARGERFNSLSITHHGGRLHSDAMPGPKRGAKAACSVGSGNSYRHPFVETLEAHQNGGWPLPITTGLAGTRPCHVFLPWHGKPRPFVGSCHGTDCAVAMR